MLAKMKHILNCNQVESVNLVRKTAGDSSLSDLDVVIQEMRDKLGSLSTWSCA